ncbi:MAG: hypothetical protein A3J27_15090 [Candidatus Tectomicrobia bacterium RIFCSPLOWO2_12_FULL_69_37]|nr:MAG: hypothetical protein A3J27_15090 [Candidatus Tectomicrobia bacterium RIFCSPLOWO2_12_FULL_69_37]
MLFNRARALGLMDQHRLDALVGTSRHNVFYLGGLDGWAQATYGDAATETFAAFFRREDQPPALIVSRQDETYYAAGGSWIADVRGYGPPSAMEIPPGARPETPEEERLLRLLPGGGAPREGNPAAALLRLLRDRGLSKGRIALDEEGLKPATRAKLASSLPGAEWLDGAGLFRLIRLQKTGAEAERIREAAMVNERAVRTFHGALAEGRTEREVAALYYLAVAEAGGKWGWLHLAGGRRSATIFPPSDRKFGRGDLFFFDAGMRLGGYSADVGGCGAFGEPAAEHLREYGAIRAGLDAALGAIREGVKPSEIFRAAVAGARKGGMPSYGGSFCGHTIGIEPREFPYTLSEPAPVSDPFLPPTSDVPLPAGAVLSVELPSGRFGHGGVHCEFTVQVTREGFEHLGAPERTFYRV